MTQTKFRITISIFILQFLAPWVCLDNLLYSIEDLHTLAPTEIELFNFNVYNNSTKSQTL